MNIKIFLLLLFLLGLATSLLASSPSIIIEAERSDLSPKLSEWSKKNQTNPKSFSLGQPAADPLVIQNRSISAFLRYLREPATRRDPLFLQSNVLSLKIMPETEINFEGISNPGWFLSQFALISSYRSYQCIAVSQTGDPTGSWFRYAYPLPALGDYPKFGVWPDGYYMSVNNYEDSFLGVGVAVFEREKMLQGQSARMVYFDGGALFADSPALLPEGDYLVSATAYGHSGEGDFSVSITKGNTETLDFSLAAKSKIQMRGKVSDSTGHGWPLLAQVKITDCPTCSPVYTDPFSGEYKITLSANESSDVECCFCGYSQGCRGMECFLQVAYVPFFPGKPQPSPISPGL